ncbi:hypothetical protein GLA29479_4114 [Lysobacter antibioticus]|nr:hypothetical protein GLA29479_4114 [Lysobacter antibioticus]
MSDTSQERHNDVAARAAPTPAKARRFDEWRQLRYLCAALVATDSLLQG